MPNINKNIIKQAGAAVANATNKAAGLAASTPEPGSIISAIQLVNGGRSIGPTALAHFTESVRNKLLSLLVTMEPVQSGTGNPSPYNVRPIGGWTGANVYVAPTPNVADARTYAIDWTTPAGTVYVVTLEVVTGVLTVTHASVNIDDLLYSYDSANKYFKTEIEDRKVGNFTFYGSSALAISPTSIFSQMPNWSFVGGGSNTNVYIKCLDYTDTTSFKNALSGQIIVYELATPLTYQLTGQDIITLVGDNYIWSDSGDVTITE